MHVRAAPGLLSSTLPLQNVTFGFKPHFTSDQDPPYSQQQVEEASSSMGLVQHLSQSLLSRCENLLNYIAKLV